MFGGLNYPSSDNRSEKKLDEDKIRENFKTKVKLVPKGHTLFVMEDGTQIFALNIKNALKKYNKQRNETKRS